MTTPAAVAPEVSERPVVRRLLIGGVVVVPVAIAVAAPVWTTDYGLVVGYQIAQLAALAVAWNLMAGYGGLVSLAVAAFVGLGSYASAKLTISAGFALLPSLLSGGAVAALFAVLVSVPMFRFRGLYFTIASLVLASALAIFMVNYDGLGGATGLTLTNVAPTLRELYYLALACAGVAVIGTVLVLRARLGMGLLAVRDDEDVAERMGVATFRTKLVAFTLSGFVMGLVGGLQAQRLGHIEPYGSFALSWTIDSVNAAIVGGIGTIVGPIVGAAIVVELAEQLADYPEAHVAITGALLIAVIRFAPGGVWGTVVRKVGRPLVDMLLPWVVRRSSVAATGVNTIERDEELASRGLAPRRSSAGPDGVAGRGTDAITGANARGRARTGDGQPILEAVGVGKAFGGVKAVSAVDVEIRAGEVLGVVGPNGAGKSTLIGLLSGAHAVDSGTVALCGHDVTPLGAQARARMGVGRTHQVPRPFPRLTVFENLTVAEMHGAGPTRGAGPRGSYGSVAWTTSPTCRHPSSACCASSAWRWHAHWRSGRACCCSTKSAPDSWTRSFASSSSSSSACATRSSRCWSSSTSST
jgi:branched-chain amino acid transport system permease protein